MADQGGIVAGGGSGPAFAPPRAPVVLTIPGLCCSGPGHWQTIWEERRRDCHRIILPHWDDPCPDAWVDAIGDALEGFAQPVLLAAHSLGCHALVRWAARSADAGHGVVTGALLVAPPDVEAVGTDPRVARFAPLVSRPLPFPARLVASRDDPYATPAASARMAALWGAEFVDVGPLGHINAQSDLGEWRQGQQLAGLVAR